MTERALNIVPGGWTPEQDFLSQQLHARVNGLRHQYYPIMPPNKAGETYHERWLRIMHHIRECHPDLSATVWQQIHAKKRRLDREERLKKFGANCVPEWERRRFVVVKVREEIQLEHFAQSVESRLNAMINAAEVALDLLKEKGLTRGVYNEVTKVLQHNNGMTKDMSLFDLLVRTTT